MRMLRPKRASYGQNERVVVARDYWLPASTKLASILLERVSQNGESDTPAFPSLISCTRHTPVKILFPGTPSHPAGLWSRWQMGGNCPKLDVDIERLGKQQDAAARKARLIRIQLQWTGKPDAEATIDPLDLVLESISRELAWEN